MEEKQKEFASLVFSRLVIISTLCARCLVVPNMESMNICFKKIINRLDKPKLMPGIPVQEIVRYSRTLSL